MAKHEATKQEVEQAAEQAAPAKPKVKPEVTEVQMTDGRKVSFVGKKQLLKTVLESEHPEVRFDFRNGETRTFRVPRVLLHRFASHGASQKIGDECSGVEKIDDMVLAVDDIIGRLDKGEWGAARKVGDSFSGASMVIKAICEVSKKSVEEVKAFLQGKLDKAKERGEPLSRAALYASFRKPGTKTGDLIAKMEAEDAAKKGGANADEMLAELS